MVGSLLLLQCYSSPILNPFTNYSDADFAQAILVSYSYTII